MTTNISKIKYINACDKLYQVTDIDITNLTITAKETNLTISDIAPDTVFDIDDFTEFRVRLCNYGGNVIDFAENVKMVS